MTNLIIVQEYSRTVDIGPIKDEQNRLERRREMVVGVRRCRHILQGFVTKVCKCHEHRALQQQFLRRSSQFCSFLIVQISTGQEYSCAIIRFVIDQCRLSLGIFEVR